MKFKNYLYCAILIACISLISGCTDGRVFCKDEVYVSGRIPYKSREAKFDSIHFDSITKPLKSIPNIQLETKSAGFVNLRDIDSNYLSNNAIRVPRYYIDRQNMTFKRKTWAHDVSIYKYEPYTLMYSKSNGLVCVEGYFLDGLKLKSKGKEFIFPLMLNELKEIFGKPDKVFKTFTHL